MRIAALLFCLCLSGGCASVQRGDLDSYLNVELDDHSIQYIHQDLQSKYTFVLQPVEMDVYKHHSGHLPFKGDCDDYLSAAKNRLIESGYIPVAVTGYSIDGEFHVFTCAQGKEPICLDPNYSRARKLSTLRRVYRQIAVYRYPELQPFKTAGANPPVD